MSRRYLVSGVVQGVGYRYFVARHARNLGLTGYAANLADGRVEVLASGPPEALGRLEDVLRQGPAAARVTGVERGEAAEPAGPPSGFEVR
jgi:acylphosphatase